MKAFAAAAFAAVASASEVEFFKTGYTTPHAYGHGTSTNVSNVNDATSLNELGKKVDLLMAGVKTLKECKLETNYFATNIAEHGLPVNAPKVLDPREICVDKNDTVEIQVQGSFESPANTVVGYQIVEKSTKYDKVVAEGRFTDAGDPSSTSVIYRETVKADSVFVVQFIGIAKDGSKLVANQNTGVSFDLEKDNVQTGIKIFSAGCGLTNEMPKECPHSFTRSYSNHGSSYSAKNPYGFNGGAKYSTAQDTGNAYGSHGYGGYYKRH